MTTGIKSGGADLDALFAPLVTTKRANVNIQSNGNVDISNRFEPRGATTARANTNIQSGGSDLAQLFKDIGAADTITISDVSFSSPSISPALAVCSYRLNTNGDIERNLNGSYSDVGDWISPKAAAPSTYEARVTITSGTLTSGTTGTWLALTTTREWLIQTNTAPGKNCQFLLEIRKGTTVLGDANIELNCAVI